MPEIKYCTDNATMVGAAAYFAYLKGLRADLHMSAKSSESLT